MKTVKGVELPINILVVVAIAVIVLLGLVALYFIGFNPFSVSTGIESIKNDGCRQLMNQNPPCNDVTAVNVTWQGAVTPFQTFMDSNYNCAGSATCVMQRCTCPGV